jgi:hypothetical protein
MQAMIAGRFSLVQAIGSTPAPRAVASSAVLKSGSANGELSRYSGPSVHLGDKQRLAAIAPRR